LIEAVACGRRLAGVPNLVWQNAAGEFVHNGRTEPNLDADDVPRPRRELVEQHRSQYFFLFDKPDSSVAAGRGCPFRCKFCSVWEFYGGKTRQMSSRRVIEEIEAVQTGHITFVDDNFMMNYRREREIAERLKAEGIRYRYSMECRTDSIVRHPDLIEKWVEVGLEAVLLGLEGASDKVLKSVNKSNTVRVNDEAIRILQANGVFIWGAFMVKPEWSAEDFKLLRDYVSGKGILHTQFTILTPFPGTQLYRQWRDTLLTDDYTCFDALHAVIPTRLPRDEFYRHFADLYRNPDWTPVYDLVREGKLTVEQCKRGNELLTAMSRWESYAANDPILRMKPTSGLGGRTGRAHR